MAMGDEEAILASIGLKVAGEDLSQLRAACTRIARRLHAGGTKVVGFVLVDLTGFDLIGEHGSAAACMDAVALVGRAHKTHEKQLIELSRLMPQDRFLGVVLVG